MSMPQDIGYENDVAGIDAFAAELWLDLPPVDTEIPSNELGVGWDTISAPPLVQAMGEIQPLIQQATADEKLEAIRLLFT